jgi:hypothetical protein
MAAIIEITQAGLGAGTAGKSRSDGLLTGGKVTVDSVGPGAVHTLTLLWVPDGDAGFAATFLQVTPTQWTWDPTPGAPGTYIILLDVDGDTDIRVLRMRTANLAIIVPGLNELADPAANLTNNGAAEVAASLDNEDEIAVLAALANLPPSLIPKPFLSGNYGGWYRWVRDITVQLDDRAAGGSPHGFQVIDSLDALAAIDTTVSFDGVSDEVRLTPIGAYWDVFFLGRRKRFESQLGVLIPPGKAEYWVAYDGPVGSVLTVTANPTTAQKAVLMSRSVMVAVIVTDATDELLNVLMVDMRHGLSMEPSEKLQSQLGLGTLWLSGLLPGNFVVDGDGSLDTHAQFDLTDGACLNQDQTFAVESGEPSADPQALTPVLDVARWLYRQGAGEWRRAAGNPSFPTNAGGATPAHNANGTSLQTPGDGQYVLATYFAVKALPSTPGGLSARDGDRLIGIVGQGVFDTAIEARAAAVRVLLDLDLEGLPNDLVPIATVIIQKDTGFGNAAAARIVSTATGGAFIDHRRLARNGAVEGDGTEAFDPDTIVTAGGAVVVAGGNVVVAS